MDPVLHWTPIFWALRIATLVVIVDGLGLFALVTARFFRWKHVKRLVLADLPEVRRLGGQLAGAGATVELAQRQDEQITALTEQVAELQAMVRGLLAESGKEQR